MPLKSPRALYARFGRDDQAEAESALTKEEGRRRLLMGRRCALHPWSSTHFLPASASISAVETHIPARPPVFAQVDAAGFLGARFSNAAITAVFASSPRAYSK